MDEETLQLKAEHHQVVLSLLEEAIEGPGTVETWRMLVRAVYECYQELFGGMKRPTP